MTQFPIEPTLAKLILLSTQPEFHCSEEVVTIVAMLSVPNIFNRPKERANEADMAREIYYIRIGSFNFIECFQSMEYQFK